MKKKKESTKQLLTQFEQAVASAIATDHVHTLELDRKLSALAHELVPEARTKALAGDYSLLRTLMRYSQQAARRQAATQRLRLSRPK